MEDAAFGVDVFFLSVGMIAQDYGWEINDWIDAYVILKSKDCYCRIIWDKEWFIFYDMKGKPILMSRDDLDMIEIMFTLREEMLENEEM